MQVEEASNPEWMTGPPVDDPDFAAEMDTGEAGTTSLKLEQKKNRLPGV